MSDQAATGIRVVVVDDSALMRRFVVQALERDPQIQVVGQAADGRSAIELVERLRPDVVTLDVNMPVLDGVATTKHLMAFCPTPILVLTAARVSHDVDLTFKMLGAGALDVMDKPEGGSAQTLDSAARDLVRRVKLLAKIRVVTHLRGRRGDPRELTAPIQSAVERGGMPAPPRLPRPAMTMFFPLIVIGASTGGPRVIHQILGDLPADLGAAVMVVQHIAEGFSPGMVEWLTSGARMPVALASEGQFIRPNEILMAPERRDMLIQPDRTIHLSNSPLLLQRPAIDVTMQAAAEVFGSRAIGVLLTGMGRDGAYGLRAIRANHGQTIAQDEASCAIFGMPRAAIEIDAAAQVLPPSKIGAQLVALVQRLLRK